VRLIRAADHPAMTSLTPSSKVLLVADRRPSPADGGTPAVRRYRLAKLRFDPRPSDPETRYEHLKRVYE
jgi:hypothetical protein